MPYVRVSLVRPQHGREAEVDRVLDQLADYYRALPGNVASYRLQHADGSSWHGRMTIWTDAQHAQPSARSDHELALRSELNLMVDPDSHEELSFEGIGGAEAAAAG